MNAVLLAGLIQFSEKRKEEKEGRRKLGKQRRREGGRETKERKKTGKLKE